MPSFLMHIMQPLCYAQSQYKQNLGSECNFERLGVQKQPQRIIFLRLSLKSFLVPFQFVGLH